MILDDGICTVFSLVDKAEPGGMPNLVPQEKTMAWFGYLDFATAEAWPTEGREETEVSTRIRILQDRSITNKDIVVLEEKHEVDESMQQYEVMRAYHGHDDENGQPITDLTLKAVRA